MRPMWFAAIVVAAVVGCAQPRQPPGGEQDRTPPRVVEVTPGPFTTLTDLRRAVVIRFDERLSERLQGVADLKDAVTVSPVTGAVRARRGRREIEISIEGGWQPGLVYRVVVEPVLRDLFGNVRTEPIELVFSTGAPIPETAVAGFVEDRLTGRPVRGARVEATRRLDDRTYVAVTDTGGFFAMRYIPAGAYDVIAWLDQNRNREADFQEPQDTGRLALGYQDTVVVEMALLPRDTIPSRLIRATPLDSMTIELAFDDYFDPGPVRGVARLHRLQDSVLVAETPLLHGTRLDSLRAAEREARAAAGQAADTVRADTVRADTTPAPPAAGLPARPRPAPGEPGARPGAGVPQPPRDRTTAPRRALPLRELIMVMPEPLAPDESYFVVVRGVVNIQGVPDGGGSARFRSPPRATPAPAPADTVASPPPDTTGLR